VTLLFLLWISGSAAFWVGALLAQISGYPITPTVTLGAAVALTLGQGAILWRLRRGRDLIGSVMLGFVPAYLGFYLQSGHWVSEVLVLGALLSLAAFNALLTQRWEQEWRVGADQENESTRGGAARGLVFTLVNIVVIAGLLLVWYFPATPLPGRGGAWVLATAAVLNQELIKRKYYGSYRGSIILAWMTSAFLVGLSLWLLAVLTLRGLG
jgi:hypothetical protein